jgi:hypothetical protein
MMPFERIETVLVAIRTAPMFLAGLGDLRPLRPLRIAPPVVRRSEFQAIPVAMNLELWKSRSMI